MNLGEFTEQGITGNPWNATFSSWTLNDLNPETTIPPRSTVEPITWTALLGRIGF